MSKMDGSYLCFLYHIASLDAHIIAQSETLPGALGSVNYTMITLDPTPTHAIMRHRGYASLH